MAVRSLPYKWTVRNLLVVVLIVMVTNIVESTTEKVNISGQREKEIELRLKQLNKQPLKSIESLNGEIIDCVSITEQIAFDHPMLKNHTIQMKPSSYPHEVSNEFDASDQSENIAQHWQLAGDCPENTIPIKRVTREDLLRVDSIENYGKKISHMNTSYPQQVYLPRNIDHEYATTSVINGVFRGGKATINIWKPKVQEVEEISVSQIWVLGGTYGFGLNTLEAGWEVNHDLHGDYYPRFFIYWTSDGYQRTGCYNLQCPGFVQTNKRISIGARIIPISTYNGQQYVVTLLIWKDLKTGNWWLKYSNNEPLGYWPSELFPNLRDGANKIEWGGEIVNKKTKGQHTTTQMGSGHFPSEGFRKASYFRVLKFVDTSNVLRDPEIVQTAVTRPTCYNLKIGYSKSWKAFFYYGGPGRNPRCL